MRVAGLIPNPAHNLQLAYSMDIRMFEKEANCVTRQIGTETIIVPVRASAANLRAVYTLNESATEIWRRIDGQTNVERIVHAFCSLYNVSPSEAEQDVAEFLSVLSSAGLIRAQEDPSAPAA